MKDIKVEYLLQRAYLEMKKQPKNKARVASWIFGSKTGNTDIFYNDFTSPINIPQKDSKRHAEQRALRNLPKGWERDDQTYSLFTTTIPCKFCLAELRKNFPTIGIIYFVDKQRNNGEWKSVDPFHIGYTNKKMLIKYKHLGTGPIAKLIQKIQNEIIKFTNKPK